MGSLFGGLFGSVVGSLFGSVAGSGCLFSKNNHTGGAKRPRAAEGGVVVVLAEEAGVAEDAEKDAGDTGTEATNWATQLAT